MCGSVLRRAALHCVVLCLMCCVVMVCFALRGVVSPPHEGSLVVRVAQSQRSMAGHLGI